MRNLKLYRTLLADNKNLVCFIYMYSVSLSWCYNKLKAYFDFEHFSCQIRTIYFGNNLSGFNAQFLQFICIIDQEVG